MAATERLPQVPAPPKKNSHPPEQKRMLFRLVAAVAAAAAAVTASILDCSAPDAPFKISKLALHPDPPVPGLNVTLELEFTNNGPEITPANAGTAATSITLNGLPYFDSKPLCEDTPCPLVVGFNNRTSETAWPLDVTGKVVSTIRWTDSAAAELLCIQTTVRVGSLRGRSDSTTTAPLLPFLNQRQRHTHDDNSTMYLSPLQLLPIP